MSADTADPSSEGYVAEYDPPPRAADPETQAAVTSPAPDGETRATSETAPEPDAMDRIHGERWIPNALVEAWRIGVRPLVFVLVAAYGYVLAPLFELAPAYVRPYEAYVLWALWGIAGIALLSGAWAYLEIKLVRYEFERSGIDMRLIVRTGVLNRRATSLELMRVRDVEVQAPLALRLIGCANLRLDTDDQSDPVLFLRGLRHPHPRMKLVVDAVRAHQRARGYREVSVG